MLFGFKGGFAQLVREKQAHLPRVPVGTLCAGQSVQADHRRFDDHLIALKLLFSIHFICKNSNIICKYKIDIFWPILFKIWALSEQIWYSIR